MRNGSRLMLLALLFCFQGAGAGKPPPVQPVAYVDLPRFMGQWYLIAAIPTAYERDAWNAVQTYTLQADGTILTSLSFHKNASDGPLKYIQAPAYVRTGSGNAIWAVRLFGPIRAQYIVAWLQLDYSMMIVARDARDYVWVFSRTPAISTADWSAVRARVISLGYDISKLYVVPQSWAPEQCKGLRQADGATC